MKIKQYIPNLLTCLNLFCGCLALVYLSRNNPVTAAWLVAIAVILDFADGFFARLLKAFSPIGKQLDSQADMVTFGVVPGFLMHKMLDNSNDLFLLQNPWMVYVPFLITIFAALRLARFTIDKRQEEGFIGLPTPAATLFVVSIPVIISNGFGLVQLIFSSPVFILAVSVFLSIVMVAEIPMFSLKFKNYRWDQNRDRFIFLLICFILILVFDWLAIPAIILLYIVWSVIGMLMKARAK